MRFYGIHGRGCFCGACERSREEERNPTRCHCCKVKFEPEDRKDDGDECDVCALDACRERDAGTPCQAEKAR